jgi:hypothetical protein
MYLRGGYYDLALETRQRADPLVQQLVTLASEPNLEDFRPQVAAVLERSASHGAFMQEKLNELAAEIQRTNQARQRTAQVAPIYAGAPPLAVPRFEAAG